VAEVQGIYQRLYEEIHGERPLVTTKSRAIAAKLVRGHGVAAVIARLRAFAKTDDRGVWSMGFSWQALAVEWRWNRLAELIPKQWSCSCRPVCKGVNEHSRRQTAYFRSDPEGLAYSCKHDPMCETVDACEELGLRARIAGNR
jgi:hypothetical protein